MVYFYRQEQSSTLSSFAAILRKITSPFHPHHLKGRKILMPKSPLLNQVREVIRLRHYSTRTEEAYVNSIKQASELEARWNAAFVVTCIFQLSR